MQELELVIKESFSNLLQECFYILTNVLILVYRWCNLLCSSFPTADGFY